MKIIHMIYPVIGIMLALVVCITPVAAVNFYMVDVDKDEDGVIQSYTYRNVLNKSEEYIKITSGGTRQLWSLVTFEPVGIPYTPKMVVDTYRENVKDVTIYLPRSVDEWEIKYYSNILPLKTPEVFFLENAGVVNLNEEFRKDIGKGLYLELSLNQCIRSVSRPLHYWAIPDVYNPYFDN